MSLKRTLFLCLFCSPLWAVEQTNYKFLYEELLKETNALKEQNLILEEKYNALAYEHSDEKKQINVDTYKIKSEIFKFDTIKKFVIIQNYNTTNLSVCLWLEELIQKFNGPNKNTFAHFFRDMDDRKPLSDEFLTKLFEKEPLEEQREKASKARQIIEKFILKIYDNPALKNRLAPFFTTEDYFDNKPLNPMWFLNIMIKKRADETFAPKTTAKFLERFKESPEFKVWFLQQCDDVMPVVEELQKVFGPDFAKEITSAEVDLMKKTVAALS